MSSRCFALSFASLVLLAGCTPDHVAGPIAVPTRTSPIVNGAPDPANT